MRYFGGAQKDRTAQSPIMVTSSSGWTGATASHGVLPLRRARSDHGRLPHHLTFRKAAWRDAELNMAEDLIDRPCQHPPSMVRPPAAATPVVSAVSVAIAYACSFTAGRAQVLLRVTHDVVSPVNQRALRTCAQGSGRHDKAQLAPGGHTADDSAATPGSRAGQLKFMSCSLAALWTEYEPFDSPNRGKTNCRFAAETWRRGCSDLA